ncbi:MAG: hypothetical protein HN597_14925 [Desulfobacula sp.]|jgi:hypothetical protein|uniref:hypothetical protein n=1 Tax=Desulfobacula sp. TaxID=2593537 RepID=UPI0039B91014|nr:hypothetical protein [Desulfobacula sp.]
MPSTDQKSIKMFANNLDAFISDLALPQFKSKEAQNLTLSLVSEIKEAIYRFENGGKLFQ